MKPNGTASELDDAALLRAVAAGDEAAVGALFDRHAPWLEIRLRRRCSDPDAVADVLQDTFVAVWRGARHFRGDGEVAAWIWGIAAKRLVSRMRGRQDALTFVSDPDPDAVILASAEDQALLGVEHGDAGAALRRLSPELRAVVQATLLDGLTTRAAARALGIKQTTVKARLRRAREQLRGDLIATMTPGGVLS